MTSSSTLDGRHREMLKHFSKIGNNLPSYEKKLDKLLKKIEKMQKKKSHRLTLEEIQKKFKLQDEINKVKEDIDRVRNDTDRSNYYLNTSDLLFKYYNNKYYSSKMDIEYEEMEIRAPDILKFFGKEENCDMSKYINKKNKFKRTDVYDEYLSKIDDTYSGRIEYNNSTQFCKKCNIEKILIPSEAIYVCTNCGSSEYVIIDSEKPSYKEPPSDVNYWIFFEYIRFYIRLYFCGSKSQNSKFWLVNDF